ncbi:unnamed protein product [Jaminaea pallidilutea]
MVLTTDSEDPPTLQELRDVATTVTAAVARRSWSDILAYPPVTQLVACHDTLTRYLAQPLITPTTEPKAAIGVDEAALQLLDALKRAHRKPVILVDVNNDFCATPAITVVARLSSGTELQRLALKNDVIRWNLSLFPALFSRLGSAYDRAPVTNIVKIGSAIAGIDSDGHHQLWEDDIDFAKTTCLVVHSPSGLCADLPSLAHLVAKLPSGATIAITHGLCEVALFSRADILEHCAEPRSHPVFDYMEQAECFRRLQAVAMQYAGHDVKRHGGFDKFSEWRVEGSSNSDTLEEVCPECGNSVSCRDVRDFARHLYDRHGSALRLRDFDAATHRAMKLLRRANGVLYRHAVVASKLSERGIHHKRKRD